MQFRRLSRRPTGLLILVVMVLFGTPVAFAQDQSTEHAALVIAGWKDWASRLLSGRYRAVGRVECHEDEAVRLSGDVKIRCAFDYPNGRYRFDRQQPYPVASIVKDLEGRIIERNEPPLKNIVRQLRYSRTNDKSMYWSKGDDDDDESTISISPPDRGPMREVYPLDVRIMGVVTFTEFKDGQPELGGKMLDQIAEFLRKNRVEKVVRHPNGLTEIVWQMHYSDRGRMIAWFDERNGFLPVRTEFWHRYGDSKDFNNFLGRQEIHWTQKNGVTVPESCIAEERSGKEDYHRFSLRFDWESVNAAIPESVFDVKADIPEDQTYVWDSRLGKPILVAAPGLNATPHKSTPPTQASWGQRVFLVTLSTSAVALLWLFLRARIKRP